MYLLFWSNSYPNSGEDVTVALEEALQNFRERNGEDDDDDDDDDDNGDAEENVDGVNVVVADADVLLSSEEEWVCLVDSLRPSP